MCVAAKVLLAIIGGPCRSGGSPQLERETLLGLLEFAVQARFYLRNILFTDQKCGWEAAALVAAGTMAALAIALERGVHTREGLPSLEAELLLAIGHMLSALGSNIGGLSSDCYAQMKDVGARLRLAGAAVEAAEVILRLLGFVVQNRQRLVAHLGDGVGRALAAATSPALALLSCSYELLQPLTEGAPFIVPSALLASGYNAAASAVKVTLCLASLDEGDWAALSSGEVHIPRLFSWHLLSAALRLSSVLSKTLTQMPEGIPTASTEACGPECGQRYFDCSGRREGYETGHETGKFCQIFQFQKAF